MKSLKLPLAILILLLLIWLLTAYQAGPRRMERRHPQTLHRTP